MKKDFLCYIGLCIMGYRQSVYQAGTELRLFADELCRNPLYHCRHHSFAYTWHKGMWKEIRQHNKLFLNLILINMFMGYTAFYFGVDFVSGAISSIIMGMTPLINVLLAHLLASNDRLNVHKIISLIVSLIGLLLIVGMGSNGAPLDWKGITGIVLLLLSIIFQGYSAISVSEDKGKINPIFLNAVQMFFADCSSI